MLGDILRKAARPLRQLGVMAILGACTTVAPAKTDQAVLPRSVQPAVGLRVVSEKPFPSGGAVELIVYSEQLGRDYAVVVTPPSGDFALRGQKLPVIYALDGGYGIAGPLGQFMGGSGMMSPAYVISVGIADANRINDFIDTPVQRDGATVGGGGAKFRTFLTSELRPHLEARYPINPERTILFGHSLGGALAAKMLSEAPESFSGYVIASPALWAAPELPEALATAATKGAGRSVYVTVGEKEQPDLLKDADRVVAALTGSGSSFKVEKRIFAGETHVSYIPQLVPAAFRWMLPAAPPPTVVRTAIAVTPETLDRFVGTYQLEDGRTIDITRSQTQLFSQASTSRTKAPLSAETLERFFVPGFDYVVTFQGAAGAPATGLIFQLNGAEVRATRKSP